MSDAPRKRLLLVEDHAPLLRVIAKCLQLEGYDVATARSAEEAMLYMADTIPDLVVTDVMMPGADGFTLAARIRENPRTDLIPVVFLTAMDTRESRIRGFRVGVDAYLVKPFEPEELVAALESILARVRLTHRRVARLTTPEVAAKADLAPVVADARDSYADLTEGETRVALGVARGLSNKDIAAELGISHRTVEMHVSHILSKKSLSNRVELATHMMERERRIGARGGAERE